MVSTFAPGTLVATVFCFCCWSWLVYKNLMDYRFYFAVACLFSAVAYLFAGAEYIDLFYVHPKSEPDTAMWYLFLRMVCHCATALIFVHKYRFSLKHGRKYD